MTPDSRRSFLKGSSLFAAALVLASSARAQDPPKETPPKDDPPKDAGPRQDPARKEPPKKEERRRGPKTDEEILAEQEKARAVLIDDDGREYQVCPQCGFKLYKQGRTWTCSNCGYSYVE